MKGRGAYKVVGVGVLISIGAYVYYSGEEEPTTVDQGCSLVYTIKVQEQECFDGWFTYSVDDIEYCGKCQDVINGCDGDCIPIWYTPNSHPRCKCTEE